jgi:hypothetical protein
MCKRNSSFLVIDEDAFRNWMWQMSFRWHCSVPRGQKCWNVIWGEEKREGTHKKQLGYSLLLAHTYVTCCGGNTNHKTTRDIKMYIEIQISKLRAAVKAVQELLKSCRLANVCPLSGLITGRKGKNYLSYTHSLHYPTCIKKWLNKEQWYKRERERTTQ